MRYRGRNVFGMSVPRSGITYALDFEWRLAARWAGFRRFRQFEALSADEQSEIVATYRAATQMQAVVEHETARKVEREAKH